MEEKKQTETATTKKEPYVSINVKEDDILCTLPHREFRLYYKIKWLATFKTGVVGRWARQHITYDQLAALVSVPASPGRPAETIDRKEAHRLMQRLEKAGLVADIGERADNGGLTCRLPLSPLEAATKLPQAKTPKSPAKPCPATDSEGLAEPLSVLINTKNINTPSHTAGADVTNACVGGADAISTPPTETTPLAPQALTLRYIEKRLSDARFEYVTSAKSRRYYERWIERGITPEQFERATKSVEEDFEFAQIPDSVDEKLRNSRKRRRSGFGRVAL